MYRKGISPFCAVVSLLYLDFIFVSRGDVSKTNIPDGCYWHYDIVFFFYSVSLFIFPFKGVTH